MDRRKAFHNNFTRAPETAASDVRVILNYPPLCSTAQPNLRPIVHEGGLGGVGWDLWSLMIHGGGLGSKRGVELVSHRDCGIHGWVAATHTHTHACAATTLRGHARPTRQSGGGRSVCVWPHTHARTLAQPPPYLRGTPSYPPWREEKGVWRGARGVGEMESHLAGGSDPVIAHTLATTRTATRAGEGERVERERERERDTW